MFKVLALSGGGYRGLYTAQIIDDLEQSIGQPFATRFNLIAGTSIGGILGLALALEIPAARIVKLFTAHGDEIFARRWSLMGILRARYSTEKLRELLSADELFGDRLLGACKHPIIVPSINYTTGQAVLFKTAHHKALKRDYKMPLVDVALATSAAPNYFPRHIYANCQYVDGGLYANAPGSLAVHEATEFFNQPIAEVHVLAIGTMSSRFTVDARRRPTGGLLDWGRGNLTKAPGRLFDLFISVQEKQSIDMLSHRLGERYVHIDDPISNERSLAVGLDRTDHVAQEVLRGAASERSKACLGDSKVMGFLQSPTTKSLFFCGEYANEGQPC
jgi:uncharacterized protein